jgi:ATP-dependent 26S proteasome regulatory subunit
MCILVRLSLKDLEKNYEKTEDDIKAVQSVGQIIGEVMKKLDDERCEYTAFAHCHDTDVLDSHCEGLFRSPLCRLV